MTTLASALVPSTQRPIPLKGRDDLVVNVIDYQGVGYWVIKDPVGLKYHRLQGEQYRVLRLLDGERSLEEIRDEIHREFPTIRLSLTDVQHLITDLHKKGLAQSNRPGQAVSLLKGHYKERRGRLLKTLKNVLYVRLPGWDPEATLRKLYPVTKWIFHPWAVSVATLMVVSAWLLLIVQFDSFRSSLPEFQQFFGWPNLMYLWVALGVTKVIHEFGHGLSCKHFGGECHEMGLMLLVFSPCLYCDVSDSWMLRSKWKRIIIGGAGMYIEVILSAIAVYIWLNSSPGMLHYLALNIFFVTTITTVIFNANPLMRFDGYYMLSDLLEIPNLRPKADKLVRESFAWYCLGIESKPDPFMPETGRVWFVLFAISASIYRWFILFGITIFLYTVLKPYGLQSLGIIMAVFSIGGILINAIVNIYKIVSAPRIDPMSVPKIAVTLVTVVGVTAFVLMIPLPLHFETSLLIEPEGMQQVYVSTPGRLKTLKVEPGQRVSEGDALAILENPEMEDKYRGLLTERAIQEIEIEVYHELDHLGKEQLAAEKLRGINEQITDYERQLKQLTVRATCDGIVIAPPNVPKPKSGSANKTLERWHGTPLEPRNAGCFLDARTHLLSIAPNDRYEAILLVDQGDRNDVEVGHKVELKFEHLADETFEGTVKTISDRHLEFAPQALSNKGGGEMATVTDEQGRERLTSIAYQATVHLDENVHLLKPGIRGRGRFLVTRRSAGEWIWRYLLRTFHFRL